ncbi:hypothetical protein Sdia_60470 [Streptomyces diastaticus subsp. diastaticus]|uniref:Peptidase S33 tripeptidyl aminopeptidase-like C-terminal domain-containing protein n=2 Tax=Streptomyces diastaticus TaxID=1956 RepID=A0ABQ1CYE9_STRDI|nr:hypothetical protein Sdia_60470 [Streptomyces diastaticus subsp. diastaticus]
MFPGSGQVPGTSTCAGLPAPDRPPVEPGRAGGPLLLVAHRDEVVTPLPWARAMRARTGGSLLVVADGEHATVTGGACAGRVTAFFTQAGGDAGTGGGVRALTPGRPRGHSLRARRRRPGWGSGSRPRGGVLWWAGTTRAGVPPVSGTAPGGTVVRPLVQAGRIDAPAPEARPGHAAGACALFASSVEAAGTGCGDQHGVVVRSHHLADAGGPAATTTRRSGSRTGPRLARRRVTDDGRRATGDGRRATGRATGERDGRRGRHG